MGVDVCRRFVQRSHTHHYWYSIGKNCFIFILLLKYCFVLGFVALFTLPKVYENNKTQIDQNIEVVRSKIAELTNKYDFFYAYRGLTEIYTEWYLLG